MKEDGGDDDDDDGGGDRSMMIVFVTKSGRASESHGTGEGTREKGKAKAMKQE